MSRSFLYAECAECGWDCVLPEAEFHRRLICPLCADDSGRLVPLYEREAQPTDRPEGRDARQETTQ